MQASANETVSLYILNIQLSLFFVSSLQVKGKPEIVGTKAGPVEPVQRCSEYFFQEKSFTCITFKPDLAKFGMAHLDDALLVGWAEL